MPFATESLFHFDPITILLLLVGFIGTWYTLRADSTWHTAWIRKHDQECDEQRKVNNRMLGELQATNAHLITLTEGHEKRLDRVERNLDR